MSGFGITVTMLATQLSEAVLKDEAPECGGFDLSAGLFGPNVSTWIRLVAEEIDMDTPGGGRDRHTARRTRRNEAAGASINFTWQPIETAPTDRTILAWDKDYGVVFCRWVIPLFGRAHWLPTGVDSEIEYIIAPSHWQEIPFPPVTEPVNSRSVFPR